MKNSLKPYLLYLVFLCAVGTSADASAEYLRSDSILTAQKNWNKINNRMNRFCNAVQHYVKVVTKIKPEDSAISRDALVYSDSVQQSLKRTGPDDTAAIRNVETLFDTLIVVSFRLVDKVENDTAFMSNRAVKSLTNNMQVLRSNISQYRQNLNESASRRKEKRGEKGSHNTNKF